MDDNPYKPPRSRLDEQQDKGEANSTPRPPSATNVSDFLAWLIQIAAVAVFGYGCRLAFFPPPNVRSYGTMELIEPAMLTILLALLALPLGIFGGFRKTNVLLSGLLILGCVLVLLVA